VGDAYDGADYDGEQSLVGDYADGITCDDRVLKCGVEYDEESTGDVHADGHGPWDDVRG